nr:tetratricopeptide repeat protein [Xenophilus sp. Marseille-Q4582]
MAFGAGAALASEHDAVDALIQSRKYDEALSRADQYLAGKPRDVQMRFLKGVAQLESNRRADAIATFTQLTQDAPELPEPYNNLAVLHASQGQYDRARVALESALRTNPSYATAQENLGDVYARLAGDAYSQALQLGQNQAAVAPKLAVIRTLFPGAGAGGAATAPEAATQLAAPAASAQVARAPSTPSAPVAAPAAVAPPAPAPAKPPLVAAAPAAPVARPAPATPATAVAPPKPAAVADAPSAKEGPATPSVADAPAQAAVEKAVRDWAAAWAAQDMKAYLGAYASTFEVPGGASRAAWEEERRQRIVGKSGIEVQLQQLQVSVDGDKAVARFLQIYKADALNVRSRKTLNLQQQGGAWRITREAVGGR